jgi:hypothetical protein
MAIPKDFLSVVGARSYATTMMWKWNKCNAVSNSIFVLKSRTRLAKFIALHSGYLGCAIPRGVLVPCSIDAMSGP